jgi:hypothetical protein
MGLGPFDTEIWPALAVIEQFAPAAAESAGKLDHTLRERKLLDGDADGVGDEPAELYAAEIKVRAQFERRKLEDLVMGAGGDLADSEIMISFSRGTLASFTPTLIDATTGNPKIKKGDKLVRIENLKATPVWTFSRPLFCEEIVLSDSWLASEANWFLSIWKSRRQGPK